MTTIRVTSSPVMRILPAIAFVLFATACGGADDSAAGGDTGASVANRGSVDLTGAGATFPNPLYSKWFSLYAEKTGMRINYQPIGSGGGIRQLSEQTVDFGATDAPMTDEELAKAKGGPILHIPMVIGAVVVSYNLPGAPAALKLGGDVVADIFLGKITKWNDPRIASLNPGTTLPSTDILVVHRSDGSGTTYVFTDYLSAVSSVWRSHPGKGKEVQWPVGLGAKGNEGVAGQVKQTPGAVGYMELAYAKQNGLQMAAIRNASGQFIEPGISATTAAAASAAAGLGPDTDYRISIVDAPGAESYPISSFTWMLVYRNPTDAVKSRKLVDFLKWALSDGEQYAESLDYAPLPPSMITRLDSIVGAIQAGASK